MIITSQRLKMEPLSENDWSLFFRLQTDPEVIALCFDVPTQAEVENKFRSRLRPWSPDSDHWLCLVIRSSLEPVGVTGFCVSAGVAEVGFMLLPTFQGLGYGTESLKALVDYAQLKLGIDNFKAVVTEGNVGSSRVLEKNGFVLEKVIPNAHNIGGKSYADQIYKRAPCNR